MIDLTVSRRKALRVLAGLAALALAPSTRAAGKVRLFILSGQSNMAGLNPDVSFTPAVKQAFAGDEVVVVKHALGGQPIRRWYKGWKAPAGFPEPAGMKPGDLYDLLMDRVRQAIKDKKAIDSIAFVWMQGEADAQRGPAETYAENLAGLIRQLRGDLKRPDVVAVIGRISDFKKGGGWDIVRAAQVKVAEADARAAWVDTDDLNGPSNALHYTPEGYAELGRRFAARAIELLNRAR